MEERRNICFGSIKVKDNKTEGFIVNAVWTEGDLSYKGKEILKVVTFKYVGQTSITRGYSEVKISNEERNKITGAYE